MLIRSILLGLVFVKGAWTQNQLSGSQARELALQGWQAFESNRLQEAETLLSRAVTADPDEADFQAGYAAVLNKEGKVDLAISHWNSAVRLSPKDAEMRLSLARAYQALDRDDQALAALRLLHIPSEVQSVWALTRGFSLFRLGRYDAAQKDFESILEDQRTAAPAHFFLGNVFFAQDNFQRAADYFATAVREGDRPDNPAFNAYTYDYGLTLYRLRQYQQAADQFRKSIERYSSDPLPWLWLGRSEQEMGHYPQAIAALERSIQIRSDFRASYFQLARLQYQHGDKQRAAELFAAISKMKQSNATNDERAATLPKLDGSHGNP